MATTLASLTAEIADELARGDLTPQIEAAIRRAIRKYSGWRLRFNERQYTFSTSAGQPFYPMAGWQVLEPGGARPMLAGEGCISADTVSVRRPAGSGFFAVPLVSRHFAVEVIGRNSTPGVPAYVSLFDDALFLAPEPAAAFTIEVTGLHRFAPLTAPTDTNPWLVAGEDLTRSAAKVIVLRDILRDGDGLPFAIEAERDALSQLERAAVEAAAGYLHPSVEDML